MDKISQRAEAELTAAVLTYANSFEPLAPLAAKIEPGSLRWECSWHPQFFGCRAWYGDNHVPVTTAPATLPQSHGLCLDCLAKMEGEIK